MLQSLTNVIDDRVQQILNNNCIYDLHKTIHIGIKLTNFIPQLYFMKLLLMFIKVYNYGNSFRLFITVRNLP